MLQRVVVVLQVVEVHDVRLRDQHLGLSIVKKNVSDNCEFLSPIDPKLNGQSYYGAVTPRSVAKRSKNIIITVVRISIKNL